MSIRIKRVNTGRAFRMAGAVLALFTIAVPPASAGDEKPACPAQDFSSFLIAFAEDIGLQKTFTRFPYKFEYDENNIDPEGEPFVRRTRIVTREQAKLPLIYSAAKRREHGLQFLMNVDDEKAGEEVGLRSRVTIVKEDTDWQVEYYFERTRNCWELISIDDLSL